MERLGIDPATCSLEVGIFGAEPWSEGMREEIETHKPYLAAILDGR